MAEIKVSKITDTPNYSIIYDVNLPVRFFFKNDGSFDGIEVHVEDALERDKTLIAELCSDLCKALGIKFGYTIEKEDENEET